MINKIIFVVIVAVKSTKWGFYQRLLAEEKGKNQYLQTHIPLS